MLVLTVFRPVEGPARVAESEHPSMRNPRTAVCSFAQGAWVQAHTPDLATPLFTKAVTKHISGIS